MDLFVATRVRVRTTLVWLTVTSAVIALGAVLAPTLRALLHAPGPTFADLLVQTSAAVASLAAVALWATATSVAGEVLRHGSTRRTSTRSVGPLRRAVLVACGITALATAVPANADTIGTPDSTLSSATLDGLPLPDRALGRVEHAAAERRAPAPTPPRAQASEDPAPPTTTVHPGDSLWVIAARHLRADASPGEIDSYWRRIHAVNRAVIGPDPDVIRPGQTLRLPAP